MNGTYRRPKLERVPVPIQSREHPKSLNRKKKRQEMRNQLYDIMAVIDKEDSVSCHL
jgi:hypothetical protein